MDYSTHVTERLVKMVLNDVFKVVLDFEQASAKKKPKVDTGLWECLVRRTMLIDKPSNSFNLKLEMAGKKIKKEKLCKI